MNDQDLCYTPATELVRLIASRAVSPVEVMATVLERSETLNPKLNAICTWTAERAIEQAKPSGR
jgi:aspartyl-tRNA(Asn)/glutamyl-tRNA(Gln) amidotransferase subunit A